MHEFRWMAPIRVGFTSPPGIMDRDGTRYGEFWDRVAREVGRTPWTFHRASDTGSEHRVGWSKADADSLRRPLEVVSSGMAPADAPSVRDLVVTELRWTLFDHGVLLAEGRVTVADGIDPALIDDPDHWEIAVQEAGRTLARYCAESDIGELMRVLDRIPGHAEFVELEEVDVGGPLWVTRSLALNTGSLRSQDFARAWVGGIDDYHRSAIEDLIAGSIPLVARWMNHVYRPDRPREVERSWRSLVYAQFFWAAMHWIDDSLREILAWSMAERKKVSVSSLRTALRAVMNQAQELLMLRADVRQRLSRATHDEMQRFLGAWEYVELLEDPVHDKLEICKVSLESLAEDRAARSSMFTDIILMSIGVTSVLATAIALVQFGRDAGQDSSQSVFDLGNGSITSWVSSQSMDAILIVSLILSMVLLIVFIWKRRQSIS